MNRAVLSRSARTALLLLLVIVLAGLGQRLPLPAWLEASRDWLTEQQPWLAWLTFVAVYVAAVLMLLPAWPFAVAAGAWFGLWQGFLLCTAAANTAAILAFLLARRLGREAVRRRMLRYSHWPMWENAIRSSGWRIVLLLRLSPLVPFNLQNYVYGLAPLAFWPCTLATFIAMLPGTLMYVYLGHAGRWTLGSEAVARSQWEWLWLGLGLLATVALAAYLAHLAHCSLRRMNTLDSHLSSTPASSPPVAPLRPE